MWQNVGLADDLLQHEVKVEPDGSMIFRAKHFGDECERAISYNKALFNADRSSTSLWNGNSMVRVAQVPYVVLLQWMREDGVNYFKSNDETNAHLLRKLDDHNFSALRTAPGRLL